MNAKQVLQNCLIVLLGLVLLSTMVWAQFVLAGLSSELITNTRFYLVFLVLQLSLISFGILVEWRKLVYATKHRTKINALLLAFSTTLIFIRLVPIEFFHQIGVPGFSTIGLAGLLGSQFSGSALSILAGILLVRSLNRNN